MTDPMRMGGGKSGIERRVAEGILGYCSRQALLLAVPSDLRKPELLVADFCKIEVRRLEPAGVEYVADAVDDRRPADTPIFRASIHRSQLRRR